MKDRMKCREAQRRLLKRFDEGSLELDKGDLAIHVQDCPDCRLELDRLLKLKLSLERFPDERPEDSYWKNYLLRLRMRMETQPGSRRGRDPAWAPALGLALLLALFILSSPTRIAPPLWFANETSAEMSYSLTPRWEEPLTDQELESIAAAAEQHDILKSYLDQSEIDLIDVFSNHEVYQADDPLEQLSEMDDASVSTILESLKSRPIIRSWNPTRRTF